MSDAEPIIFTSARIATATQRDFYDRSLVEIWAALPPERGGTALRGQLERCAALVPPENRARVLGQTLKGRADDDKVRSEVGVLLPAKTLADFGWTVEYELEIDGQTPDLRIGKDGSTYVVEAIRLRERSSDPSVGRVAQALDGLETITPIHLVCAIVSPQASLKGLRRHMTTLLNDSPHVGDHPPYEEDGVFVSFKIPRVFPEPMSAIIGYPVEVFAGDQHDKVRNAIDGKLSTYKYPIVVAIEFGDFLDPFGATESVLLGREAFSIPVGDPGRATITRTNDAVFKRRDRTGSRAVERLQAALPFGLILRGAGFEVHTRVMTNPAADVPDSLASFSPIPRLVVTSESGSVKRLGYLDATGAPFRSKDSWFHVP